MLDLHASKKTRSLCGDCSILCCAGGLPRQRNKRDDLAKVWMRDVLRFLDGLSGPSEVELAAFTSVLGILLYQNHALH